MTREQYKISLAGRGPDPLYLGNYAASSVFIVIQPLQHALVRSSSSTKVSNLQGILSDQHKPRPGLCILFLFSKRRPSPRGFHQYKDIDNKLHFGFKNINSACVDPRHSYQKSVFAREAYMAADRTPFHVFCLKCCNCQKKLTPASLNEHQHKLYCPVCYEELFCQKEREAFENLFDISRVRTVFQREWSCKSFLLRVCLERNLRTSRRSSCLLRKLEKEKTLPRLPWPGKRPHRELTVLPHPSRSEKPWRLLLKILLHCDQLSLIKLFPFLSKSFGQI